MTTRIFEIKDIPCGSVTYMGKRKHLFKKIDWERLSQKHPYSFLLLPCVLGPILILLAVSAVVFAAALLVGLTAGGLL